MKNGFWRSEEQFSLIQPYLPCRAAGKRREAHPANAPAGSNRSSHLGDEMAEAFG
jgi:hypothetical protein